MGQRAPGMNDVEHVARERRQPTEIEPEKIEREIESLRGEIDDLVDELDRRRHDALDWRLQLRKHGKPIAIGAGMLLAVALVARGLRRKRRPLLSDQLGAILRGAYEVGRHPERFERADEGGRSLALQLAKTAALAGASVMARRMAERAVDTNR
jgi:hypothetical protein